MCIMRMFNCIRVPCDLTLGSSCIQQKQRKKTTKKKDANAHTLLELLLFKLRPGNVRAMRAQASFSNHTTGYRLF